MCRGIQDFKNLVKGKWRMNYLSVANYPCQIICFFSEIMSALNSQLYYLSHLGLLFPFLWISDIRLFEREGTQAQKITKESTGSLNWNFLLSFYNNQVMFKPIPRCSAFNPPLDHQIKQPNQSKLFSNASQCGKFRQGLPRMVNCGKTSFSTRKLALSYSTGKSLCLMNLQVICPLTPFKPIFIKQFNPPRKASMA